MRLKLAALFLLPCMYFTVLMFLEKKWFGTFAFSLTDLGIISNLLVCIANGWKMPVKVDHTSQYQIDYVARSPVHFEMDENSRFKFLGDIINTSLFTASIGDLFLVAGNIFYFSSLFF